MTTILRKLKNLELSYNIKGPYKEKIRMLVHQARKYIQHLERSLLEQTGELPEFEVPKYIEKETMDNEDTGKH